MTLHSGPTVHLELTSPWVLWGGRLRLAFLPRGHPIDLAPSAAKTIVPYCVAEILEMKGVWFVSNSTPPSCFDLLS